MIRATRRTQPHRRAVGRRRSKALGAMKRGRPAFMRNPQDIHRKRQKRLRSYAR